MSEKETERIWQLNQNGIQYSITQNCGGQHGTGNKMFNIWSAIPYWRSPQDNRPDGWTAIQIGSIRRRSGNAHALIA